MDLKEAGLYENGIENKPAKLRVVHEKYLMSLDDPPAVPVPTGPSELRIRVDARVTAIKAKFAALKALGHLPSLPPCAPEDLFDITKIEGKALGHWAVVEEKAFAKAQKAHKPGSLLVFDSPLPGWASWALTKWKANGSPSLKAKLEAEYAELQPRIIKAHEEAKDALDVTKGEIPPRELVKKMVKVKKTKETVMELEAEATVLSSKIRSLS